MIVMNPGERPEPRLEVLLILQPTDEQDDVRVLVLNPGAIDRLSRAFADDVDLDRVVEYGNIRPIHGGQPADPVRNAVRNGDHTVCRRIEPSDEPVDRAGLDHVVPAVAVSAVVRREDRCVGRGDACSGQTHHTHPREVGDQGRGVLGPEVLEDRSELRSDPQDRRPRVGQRDGGHTGVEVGLQPTLQPRGHQFDVVPTGSQAIGDGDGHPLGPADGEAWNHEREA